MRALHDAVACALPAFAGALQHNQPPAATEIPACAADAATEMPAHHAQAGAAQAPAVAHLLLPLPVRVVANGRVFYMWDMLGYVSTSF